MKSSTHDRVEGTTKQVAGKIQNKVGKAAGDTGQRVKGAMKSAEGTIQKKTGELKRDTMRE
jgi:uncharacterized protein YjbJ (UPF0337 family)